MLVGKRALLWHASLSLPRVLHARIFELVLHMAAVMNNTTQINGIVTRAALTRFCARARIHICYGMYTWNVCCARTCNSGYHCLYRLLVQSVDQHQIPLTVSVDGRWQLDYQRSRIRCARLSLKRLTFTTFRSSSRQSSRVFSSVFRRADSTSDNVLRPLLSLSIPRQKSQYALPATTLSLDVDYTPIRPSIALPDLPHKSLVAEQVDTLPCSVYSVDPTLPSIPCWTIERDGSHDGKPPSTPSSLLPHPGEPSRRFPWRPQAPTPMEPSMGPATTPFDNGALTS